MGFPCLAKKLGCRTVDGTQHLQQPLPKTFSWGLPPLRPAPIFRNPAGPPPVLLLGIPCHQQVLVGTAHFQGIINVAQRYPGTVPARVPGLCQKYGIIPFIQPDIHIMPFCIRPISILIPIADKDNCRQRPPYLRPEFLKRRRFFMEFAADSADIQRAPHFLPVNGAIFPAWGIIRSDPRIFKHIPRGNFIRRQGIINICHAAQAAPKAPKAVPVYFKLAPFPRPGTPFAPGSRALQEGIDIPFLDRRKGVRLPCIFRVCP